MPGGPKQFFLSYRSFMIFAKASKYFSKTPGVPEVPKSSRSFRLFVKASKHFSKTPGVLKYLDLTAIKESFENQKNILKLARYSRTC